MMILSTSRARAEPSRDRDLRTAARSARDVAVERKGRETMRNPVALSLALALAVGTASAQQATPPQRLRGTVEAVDGQMLMVKSREGPTLHVSLTDKTSYSGIVKASLSDIKPDKFVGIASMPQADGTQ